MNNFLDTDDVDEIIDGRNTTTEDLRATADVIAAYKAQPEYAAEVARATAILDAIPIEAQPFATADPEALLEHWRRCVAELTGGGSPPSRGPGDSQTSGAPTAAAAGPSPEPSLPPTPHDTAQSGPPNPTGTPS